MTRAALALTVLALVGCGKDEALDPEILDFSVNPTEIEAGTMATATVELANFELSGHDDMTTMTMGTDDEDGDHHGDDGDVQTGHVHIYLDDTETNPLVMMMTETADFMIPMDTAEGAHTLIARLQDADHLIIEPEVVAEFEITVTPAMGTGTMR